MRKPFRAILAGAAVLCTGFAIPTAALAERPISGAEAQRLLSGKQFLISCVDGTQGYGVFNTHGAVNVVYRRFNAPQNAPDQRDRATVQSRGNDICLAWREFGGGGDGCYPVTEMSIGHYRIGGTMRWCEIKARPASQTAQ